MKIGKVFDKLAAKKNVAQITFGDNACTVHLTNGSSLLCKSAHEARLFIEKGEQPNGSLIEEAPPATVRAVVTPHPLSAEGLGGERITLNNSLPIPSARDETISRLADEAVVLQANAVCGTEADSIITLDADYVRIRGGGLIEVPYGATQVRMTSAAAAALIAGGFDY